MRLMADWKRRSHDDAQGENQAGRAEMMGLALFIILCCAVPLMGIVGGFLDYIQDVKLTKSLDDDIAKMREDSRKMVDDWLQRNCT